MTFVWMMITMDNEGNGDVKDFGSNTNGVEDVLKSTATPTKKKKSSSFLHREYYSRIVPPLKAPIHLYVASASLIGIYTSLGKVSYKYINYATGTVLKSSKLIPVILLSSVWLKRTYHWLDYLACVLLVIASCFFALGEHEGNKQLDAEDPTLYAFGFFLSFFCVCVGAVQSNVVDKALRDYEATVSENMLMTNSIGALLVFVVVLVKEPDAFAFFFGDWFYLSLIAFRSIVFWLGAMFYTTLVKHFGAVPAVAITTCRKVLTVISSFVFFSSDKPFGVTYFVALVFFSGAVACEFFKHNTKTKSQQLEMARKDSDVEKVSDRKREEKTLLGRRGYTYSAMEEESTRSALSSLWDVIVKCDDICFTHIIPRLNQTDLKFLGRLNGETRKLIKRSSRADDLKKKFKVHETSSISTLEFAWEHYPWGTVEEEMDETYFCKRVAQTNKLELLKWAREKKKCEWDEGTIYAAAFQGNLEIVKYCVANKCPIDESACIFAAESGNLEVLKYLHEEAKVPWDFLTAALAAYHGHLHILEYLVERKYDEYDVHACEYAAEYGHLDCLKYLRETAKAPWDSDAVREAHENDQTECLQYLLDNNCPLPEGWRYEHGELRVPVS
ncbi:unnamed protein product [Bathycoccus prasinos]